MNKVFGVGWAKTGTTTLGECFKILGYKHQAQRLDLVADVGQGVLNRIMAIAEEKESFVDWPWLVLFRECDLAFPGSRFVMTVREPQHWIRSYRNMLKDKEATTKEMNKIRAILYDLPFPDVSNEQLIERYLRHQKEVTEYFYDRPDDLLVVDWEKDAGWKELCTFLGKEIPSASFPHANRGDYDR